MTLMKKMLGAAATVATSASFAVAEPALIFDLGGKFDKSFNELAFTGAQRWADDTGNSFREIELQSEAQREQALRRFAEAGNNPIVMAGFAFASALGDVAADYPDTKFTIIDMVVDAPNVRSVVFKEHEGSYLVGMMAAQASKTGTVGFIGGMDIPLIRRFACGYAQGVEAVNADIKVVANMTGTTPAAWNDPVKGSELTKAQISQGADVIYAAAGGTGVGVLQTAADENILSSMTKKVDNAVYNAFPDGPDMETGFRVMGLNNRGVGFAMDEHNAALVSDAMAATTYKAAYDIATGAVSVHDYMSDDSCPNLSF